MQTAQAYLIVFSITSRNSFEEAQIIYNVRPNCNNPSPWFWVDVCDANASSLTSSAAASERRAPSRQFSVRTRAICISSVRCRTTRHAAGQTVLESPCLPRAPKRRNISTGHSSGSFKSRRGRRLAANTRSRCWAEGVSASPRSPFNFYSVTSLTSM
jgi:hypothetical protein